jgi:hypothetical protein
MKIRLPFSQDTRIITRFALFPIRIQNEIRWLEKVTIKQEYRPDLRMFGWYNDSFCKTKAAQAGKGETDGFGT